MPSTPNADPRLPTGEWRGFYLESHNPNRGWMSLYLQFDNGRLKGEGTDYVGPWTATGTFTAERCQWIKRYVGKHQVEYDGQVTANGIVGQWQIGGLTEGPFHIWPRGFHQLERHYLEQPLTHSFGADRGVPPRGKPRSSHAEGLERVD
jgi:hypothetical protein